MKRRRLILGGVATGLGLFSGCIGGSLPGGGSSETAPGDIPVPSGYEKETTIPTPEEGVTIVRYTGSGSPSDAVAAFKRSATDAGWSEEGTIEVLGGKWSGAGFEKDDEVLVIHAKESGEDVTVTVVCAPEEMAGSEDTDGPTDTAEETATTEEEKPRQSDVEGSDIEDVPRYPGSVRVDYVRHETDTEIEISIKYVAEATFDEAMEFYEEALPDNGWTIQETVHADDQGGIKANKGSKIVLIRWETNSDYEGYLDIEIGLLKQK